MGNLKSKEDIAFIEMRNLRKDLTVLLQKNGGEVPKTVQKLKNFTNEFYKFTVEHLETAGFKSSIKIILLVPRKEDLETVRPTIDMSQVKKRIPTGNGPSGSTGNSTIENPTGSVDSSSPADRRSEIKESTEIGVKSDAKL